MNSKLRQTEHENGLIWFRQGHYIQALSIFKSAVSNYGPHIGLLSDISACYSLIDDIEGLNESTEFLQSEFKLAQCKLSPANIARTHLFLSKLYEDQAKVSLSLQELDLASKINNLPAELKIKIRCNQLRLLSFLQMNENLEYYYHLCLQFDTANENLNVELQHSLILSEFELFGPHISMSRLKVFINSSLENILSEDKNLLVFDYLELWILHYLKKYKYFMNNESKENHSDDSKFLELTNENNCFDFLSIIKSVNNLNHFEQVILEIFNTLRNRNDTSFLVNNSLINVNDIYVLILSAFKTTSKMNLIRLLALLTNLDQHSNPEFKKQFNFILKSLDQKSRKLILEKYFPEKFYIENSSNLSDTIADSKIDSNNDKKLNSISNSKSKLNLEKHKLNWNTESNILSFNSLSLTIKDRSFLQQLLNQFKNMNTRSTAEIFKNIYDIELTFDNISRLRMAVKRVNSDIYKHLEIENLFTFSKYFIQISKPFELIIHNTNQTVNKKERISS